MSLPAKFNFYKPKAGEIDDIPTNGFLQPKYDGYRVIIAGGVILSSNLTPVRNKLVQRLFGRNELNGLDGEIVAGPANAPDVVRRTSKLMLSFDAEDDATFIVFDCIHNIGDTYAARYTRAKQVIRDAKIKHVVATKSVSFFGRANLMMIEEEFIEDGYEGLVYRDPSAPYKFGRATGVSGFKLKRFVDSEAIITGLNEGNHNTNEATRDARGKIKRSGAKGGKVGRGLIASVDAVDAYTGDPLRIKGFTEAQGLAMFASPELFLGGLITYKHFPHGAKDRARHPNFKLARSFKDMTSENMAKARAAAAEYAGEKLRDVSALM